MKKLILVSLLAVSVVGLESSCWKHSVARVHLRGADSPETELAINQTRVYPYSLIPGGVQNEAEFRTYRSIDKLLESHYQGIGDHLTASPIGEDRWLYASYRVDEKIYWTKKKIQIHQGEMVLSDGSNLVRGRCGNRLSNVPQKPVRRFEPPSVTTGIVVPVKPLIVELPNIPPTAPEGPRLPGLPTVLAPAPPQMSTVVSPPPSPGLVRVPPSWPPTPPLIPTTPWPPPPTNRTPITLVPEAQTSLLMFSGLLVLLVVYWVRGVGRVTRPNLISVSKH
jgi:hypothetical protein